MIPLILVYIITCQRRVLKGFLCSVLPQGFGVVGSETSERAVKIKKYKTRASATQTQARLFSNPVPTFLTLRSLQTSMVTLLLPYPNIRLRPSAMTSGREGARIRKSSAILLAFRISLQSKFPNAHLFSFFSLLIGVQVSPIQTAHPSRIQRLSTILLLPRAVKIPF